MSLCIVTGQKLSGLMDLMMALMFTGILLTFWPGYIMKGGFFMLTKGCGD